ncbi:MAG: tetratricopeptide repeat protein [Bradyrhizobium sp.]|nr:tetratricopeptide repeat protein [Bradyrhizobium sp.]
MANSDPLAEAKRLLGRDSAAALAAARAAHAARATPETILLFATAARRNGDPAQAVALLEPLAAAAPNAWGAQYELGIALAATGHDARGIAALERAATLNPKATGPRHALRDLDAVTGAKPEGPAIASLEDPSLQTAVAALLDGKAGARDALLRGFGLDVDDIAAACLIADIGVRLGRDTAVAALLARVLPLAPAYRPARFRLAEALHRTERDEEALVAVLPLCSAEPSAIGRALRGAILMRLGREEEALADLTAVAEAEPGHATSLLALGHALRALGRRDDAITAYRRALAIDPALADAWWSIADLKTAAFVPGDLAVMEMLRADTALPPRARSQVEFALGRAREDAGDYARAFAHYDTANTLRRAIEPYDEAAYRSAVQRLIEMTDEAFFVARAGFGNLDPGPIFVVGMPRSGSTLVEQILASHSQVEGLSELPAITNLARTIADYPAGLAGLSSEALRRFGTDYLSLTRARRRTDVPYAVDKFPGNAFHAALIQLILPNARIVDVRRDPLDCCVSLFSQSFAAGQAYSYDLFDLGRHYARYETLMRHFDDVLPGRILRVSYEALVDDLEGETRRLLAYCGLDFEPATQRFFDRRGAVRTASSEQVRQPVYRSSIGRWRRFEQWLEPLQEGLASRDF